MKTLRFRPNALLLFALAAALSVGACDDASDSDKDEDAIETNLVPAPCKGDKDCGEDVACGENGFCVVEEMVVDAGDGVSSATPAQCDVDADCGPGVKCTSLSDDGPKFCDVQETTVSSGAPAPCVTDAECGTAKCVEREGGGKFCDVNEMVVTP